MGACIHPSTHPSNHCRHPSEARGTQRGRFRHLPLPALGGGCRTTPPLLATGPAHLLRAPRTPWTPGPPRPAPL
eukprot:9001747-Alexandrium_andersonii.AAC.1